jgi:hypothetical protein
VSGIHVTAEIAAKIEARRAAYAAGKKKITPRRILEALCSYCQKGGGTLHRLHTDNGDPFYHLECARAARKKPTPLPNLGKLSRGIE